MRFPEGGSPDRPQSFRPFAEYGQLSEAERAWLDKSGKFWRDARLKSRLSRIDLERKLGIMRQDLALFEHGLVPQEIYYGDLPRRYAGALGNQQLYENYCQQLNIPQPDPEIFGR